MFVSVWFLVSRFRFDQENRESFVFEAAKDFRIYTLWFRERKKKKEMFKARDGEEQKQKKNLDLHDKLKEKEEEKEEKEENQNEEDKRNEEDKVRKELKENSFEVCEFSSSPFSLFFQFCFLSLLSLPSLHSHLLSFDLFLCFAFFLIFLNKKKGIIQNCF